MASMIVDDPVGALQDHWSIIFNEIVPRVTPQVLGTIKQIPQQNNLIPPETNPGVAGHNLGNQQTSANVLYGGTPYYLQISVDLYFYADTAQTAYYGSNYQLANWIKNITVTGGLNDATLISMDGITAGILVPRSMFALDVLSSIGAAGDFRHPQWPFSGAGGTSQGGAVVQQANSPTVNGHKIVHLAWDWYVPFSRHSNMAFGSPLSSSAGVYNVNITWNPLFGTDLRNSPFGYVKNAAVVDTNSFVLTDQGGNPGNYVQVRCIFKGGTPPPIDLAAVSSADKLTERQALALYGQQLHTTTEAPLPVLQTQQVQNLQGQHLLSNMWVYFDYAQTIATAANGSGGPQSIIGAPWPETNFMWTSTPATLNGAAGTPLDLYGGDMRSLAGIAWLENNGIDTMNGCVWLVKDNPGGVAGSMVIPTNTLDYTGINQYQFAFGVNNIATNPRIIITRQYYELVVPALQQ